MGYNSYPTIFKKCVLKYYKDNTVRNTLNTFGISNGTLFNWCKLDKTNNITEKKNYNKKNVKITTNIKLYIRWYVIKYYNFNYKKLLVAIYRKYKIHISKTSLYNILKQLNITRKKIYKPRIYKRKTTVKERKKLLKQTMKNIGIENIICIDETSFDTSVSPIYGWSKAGHKIEKAVNAVRKRYSIISAISNNKIISIKAISGSANGEVFLKFIKNIINENGNVHIFLDNARIHHYTKLKEYIDTTKSTLIYNIPYCPKYNPIEIVFSKVKNMVRNKTNNQSNLIKNINNAFNKITKNDLNNFYNKSFGNLLK